MGAHVEPTYEMRGDGASTVNSTDIQVLTGRKGKGKEISRQLVVSGYVRLSTMDTTRAGRLGRRWGSVANNNSSSFRTMGLALSHWQAAQTSRAEVGRTSRRGKDEERCLEPRTGVNVVKVPLTRPSVHLK